MINTWRYMRKPIKALKMYFNLHKKVNEFLKQINLENLF